MNELNNSKSYKNNSNAVIFNNNKSLQEVTLTQSPEKTNNNRKLNDPTSYPRHDQTSKQKASIIDNKQNNINQNKNSSENFFSPNEFKQLWESVISTELIDLFDFCIKDYILIANLCQDILLLVYEESKIIIEHKFCDILKCLNLDNKSKDKKNSIYTKFLPLFQENFNDIFLLVDSSLNTLHKKLALVINEYNFESNSNLKLIIQKKINGGYFDNLLKSFYKICIYMLLHDPILTFDLIKHKNRKQIYCYYNKKQHINLEGFGGDNSPCIILLQPPLLKNKFPFHGLRPAVYIISEPNDDIVKECELNKLKYDNINNKNFKIKFQNRNNEQNLQLKSVKTLNKNNVNYKSETNIYSKKKMKIQNDNDNNCKIHKNIDKKTTIKVHPIKNNLNNNNLDSNREYKANNTNNQNINNNSLEFKDLKSLKMNKIVENKKRTNKNLNNYLKNNNKHSQTHSLNNKRELSNNVNKNVIINNSNSKFIDPNQIKQIQNRRIEAYYNQNKYKKNINLCPNSKLITNNISMNNLNNFINEINHSFTKNNNSNNNCITFFPSNKKYSNHKMKSSNSHNDIRKPLYSIQAVNNNYSNNNFKNNDFALPYNSYLMNNQTSKNLKNQNNINSYNYKNYDNRENFYRYPNTNKYICSNYNNNNTNINSFNLNIINNCLIKSEIKEKSNKEEMESNKHKSSNSINNKNNYIYDPESNNNNYSSNKKHRPFNISTKINNIAIKNLQNDDEGNLIYANSTINLGNYYINPGINNKNIVENNIFLSHFSKNMNNQYSNRNNSNIYKESNTIERKRNNNSEKFNIKKKIKKNASNNNIFNCYYNNFSEKDQFSPNYDQNISEYNTFLRKSLENKNSINEFNFDKLQRNQNNNKMDLYNFYNFQNY